MSVGKHTREMIDALHDLVELGSERLNEWETGFVESVHSQVEDSDRNLSDKQLGIITRLYDEKVDI